MKTNINKSANLRTARPAQKAVRRRKKASNKSLATNYELMLRFYLINKEQASLKQELRYTKPIAAKAELSTSATPVVIWGNITHAIGKATQMISILSRPKISFLTK
jgi:hypothetical protein